MKGFLKCSCVHCGGHIEFPGSAIDTIIACPHCGNQTALRLEDFEEETAEDTSEGGPVRMLIISIVILTVASLAIAGGYRYLKNKAAKSGTHKETAAPAPPAKSNSGAPSKTSASKMESLPEAPSAPELVVDADPAKHRFPVEAARRAAPAGEIKSGREVYLGHCSECHVFYDPAAYPGTQWPTILGKMEGKAKLGRDERERLERFTQTLRAPGT